MHEHAEQSSDALPFDPSAIERVLLYRLGSLGDTLIALPAFHLAARAFPNARRLLLTNDPVSSKAPPAAAILGSTSEGASLVHGFLRYTVGTRSPTELLRLWWQIVRFRPQVLVYIGAARGVASARRDAAFFRLCGIRRQVGVPLDGVMNQNLREPASRRGTDSSLTHLGAPGYLTPDLPSTLEPEAARLTRNLAALGPAHLNDPAVWDLRLTPAEHARAAELLAPAGSCPILAVSVGTKVQSKDWGRDNWQALLTRLAALLPGHALALAGAAEESEVSSFAAAHWSTHSAGPVLNLCGRLTPRESAAAFSRARLFLGHDSGPMHLAAAVQTPCVAIFAARNLPRVWFPFGAHHRVLYHPVDCMGCGLETCLIERKKCLTSITVDEVLAAVEASLNAAPSPARGPSHQDATALG